MSPPAKIITPPFTGQPPPGLTKPSDIAFWNAFIELDNAIPNPASADGFLFYCGEDGASHAYNLGCIRQYISEFYSRDVAPWTLVLDLKVDLSRDKNSPSNKLRALFDSYLDGPEDESATRNLHIKCISWSIARRAAIHGDTVHLALWKGAPLLVKNSYWGRFEAGIITDPSSNVQRIVRWDVEKLGDTGLIAIDPGMVVWEREKHKPLGIPKEQQDWMARSEDYNKEDVVWHAEPLDRGKSLGKSLLGFVKRLGGKSTTAK